MPLADPTRLITLAARAKGNGNHWLSYSRSKCEKPPQTAEETAKENFLQSVIHHISENWSISKRCLPMDVLPFWSSKDQYPSMKASSTEPNWKVHRAHMGVKSTLRRAFTSLWWPGMNSQLKQFISSCQVCQSVQRNNPKESLMSHSIPDRP